MPTKKLDRGFRVIGYQAYSLSSTPSPLSPHPFTKVNVFCLRSLPSFPNRTFRGEEGTSRSKPRTPSRVVVTVSNTGRGTMDPTNDSITETPLGLTHLHGYVEPRCRTCNVLLHHLKSVLKPNVFTKTKRLSNVGCSFVVHVCVLSKIVL